MYDVNDLFSMAGVVEADIQSASTQVAGSRRKIEKLQNDKKVREDCWRALRLIQEKYNEDSIKLLQQMLNTGVQAIFDDQQYRIEIEVTEGKRKGVKLWLVEGDDENPKKSRIPTAIGGGIQVVLSFILNVYLIRIYGLRPFIVMDESFTQISTQYIPNFIQFLRYLQEELDFTFLWVSHDERVIPYFDRVYQVTKGTVKKSCGQLVDNSVDSSNTGGFGGKAKMRFAYSSNGSPDPPTRVGGNFPYRLISTQMEYCIY